MVAISKSSPPLDLAAIADKLDRLAQAVDSIAERQRRSDELIEEMGPIFKQVMASATDKLDVLEKKGYFTFGAELLGVGRRIVEGYSAADVRQLGDAVVGILDTVRALTQPEVLAIAGEASQVLQRADEAEPIGLVGMVRSSRNQEVQKGMAVLMELLRHVGRAAEAAKARRAGQGRLAGKRAKLDAITGRRRVLGDERRLPAPVEPPPPRPSPLGACATPKGAPPVAAVLDGVGFTAEGYVADPATWTRELGERIAAAEGIVLRPEHWRLIEFARRDYQATSAAPNIRRITQGLGVNTKDIYALFPKAPGRTLARIAGVPKPAGCL
jgi:tRNA 2-thiouridine synthesizing protein E